MRKFLLILACAFSFCVRGETNGVYWTQDQWALLEDFLNYGLWNVNILSGGSDIWADGRVIDWNGDSFCPQMSADLGACIGQIPRILHLIMTGDLQNAYDTTNNNILAYASSLRGYLNEYSNSVYRLDSYISNYLPKIWERQLLTAAPIQGLYNDRFHAGNKVLELVNLSSNNFERLYEVITNLDFNISISNQIDLLQVMNGSFTNGLGGITNLLGLIRRRIDDFNLAEGQRLNFHFQNQNDVLRDNHSELMDFLHSLSNSNLFVSNLCNCCGGSNSNYQDSVLAMLNWMTNNFPDVAESPIGGGGGSNSLWSIWRPSDVPPSGWFHLFVPTVEWVQSGNGSQQFKPQYGDYQYDTVYNAVWDEYNTLLENYRSNGIDGQQFLAGLVDLQLHILANMSTQLYMIDQKMPSKTNLWEWIEEYKNKVSEEVTKAERENSQIISSVSSLLNYTPFSIVGGHFPKVSSALGNLRVEEGASSVVRIPIPRALRVSDSVELVVDVRESDWFTSGRNWCRWIFTFIWGWLFIRLGLVPIFYVFFFTVRVAEISAHLVFMGSVRGSSGIVSSFGAAAVDMVLSLIGIDTDFKKFVWGIMRD